MVTEAQSETEIQEEGPVLPQESEEGVQPSEGEPEEEGADSEVEARKTWEERKADIEADEEHAASFKEELARAHLEGADAERQRLPEYQQSVQLGRQVQGEIQRASTLAAELTDALQQVVATRDVDLIQGVEAVLQKSPRVADVLRTMANAKQVQALTEYFNAPLPEQVAGGPRTVGERLAHMGVGPGDLQRPLP